MAVTSYIEKLKDGTVIIREVTEKTYKYHEDSLDTALANEKNLHRLQVLENAKKLKKGEKYGTDKN